MFYAIPFFYESLYAVNFSIEIIVSCMQVILTCMYVYVYIHMYVYMYVCIYIYMYIYVCIKLTYLLKFI